MKIEVDGLGKVYKGGTEALRDVSLSIQSGMFGLLGPNGAGKTTLIRILVTLMKPSAGSVSVNGLDLHRHRREIRSMLGYLPQDFRLFSKLTTWEFLEYVAALAGVKNRQKRKRAVDQMLEQYAENLGEELGNELREGVAKLRKSLEEEDREGLSESFEALQQLAYDSTEALCSQSSPDEVADPDEGTESGKIEIRYERDWTWIKFPAKPPESVRRAIKGLGAQHSRRRCAWYIRERVKVKVVLSVIMSALEYA